MNTSWDVGDKADVLSENLDTNWELNSNIEESLQSPLSLSSVSSDFSNESSFTFSDESKSKLSENSSKRIVLYIKPIEEIETPPAKSAPFYLNESISFGLNDVCKTNHTSELDSLSASWKSKARGFSLYDSITPFVDKKKDNHDGDNQKRSSGSSISNDRAVLNGRIIYDLDIIFGYRKNEKLKSAVESYLSILSYGGQYFNKKDNNHIAILVLNLCRLPTGECANYDKIVTCLLYFIAYNIHRLKTEMYSLVLFYNGISTNTFKFIRRFYFHIRDKIINKKIANIFIVFPPFWLKALISISIPFIRRKIYDKIFYVNSLKNLSQTLPTDYIEVPEEVMCYDKLMQRK